MKTIGLVELDQIEKLKIVNLVITCCKTISPIKGISDLKRKANN